MGRVAHRLRDRDDWLTETSRYAAHLLTPTIKRQLVKRKPKCWSDDMSWIPDYEQLVPEFVACFAEHYTHPKAFHRCRPITLASYLEHGLLGQDSAAIVARFVKYFLTFQRLILMR